ncbi:HFL184Wp [Eremothecium sinecaudum]|uniref:HFL184Wp n=1 Tax=Eremothecium sinecaudum TaxID=45286 RepID=A0A0X8HUF5_9SACH|nr:HFL184Wp [Eremothecium sinecaudum]AMD21672.1 HFL184Wp [Eremothecium sinecaudum]
MESEGTQAQSGSLASNLQQEGTQVVNTDSVNIVETVGGTTTRKYLNEHITEALLRGMRRVALEKPENPLRFLGEFLIAESDRR